MRGQFASLVYKVRTSFWFFPALLMAAAAVASWLAVQVDLAYFEDLKPLWSDLNVLIGADGARSLLTTLAASMITVASLVFSMTLITLTLASSQFGPRLLEHFMGDRVTQIALGTFIATFIFCIAVLLTVRQGDDSSFVPVFSVCVAVFLGVFSFGLLVVYIHRVAISIRADSILARLEKDMVDIMTQLLRDLSEDEAAEEQSEGRALDPEGKPTRHLRAEIDGYVQMIDHKALLDAAVEHDLCVRFRVRPGHYVVRGSPVAQLWGPDEIGDEATAAIAKTITFGMQRTLAQDMEFAMSSLVEVAVRALSPGINDPNTAIAVVDRLTSALAQALSRGLPYSIIEDDNGQARVSLARTSYEGLFDLAFNEIRQEAAGKVAVLIRQIESLITLSEFVRNDTQRDVLRKHAEILKRAARREDREDCDRADMETRLETLDECLSSS